MPRRAWPATRPTTPAARSDTARRRRAASRELLEPEHHRLDRLVGAAEIAPGEIADDLRASDKALALPQRARRHIARRAQRMIGRPIDRTERRDRVAQRPRAPLTLDEECRTQTA